MDSVSLPIDAFIEGGTDSVSLTLKCDYRGMDRISLLWARDYPGGWTASHYTGDAIIRGGMENNPLLSGRHYRLKDGQRPTSHGT